MIFSEDSIVMGLFKSGSDNTIERRGGIVSAAVVGGLSAEDNLLSALEMHSLMKGMIMKR